jgi:predicted AAA+ superfamily ATPase
MYNVFVTDESERFWKEEIMDFPQTGYNSTVCLESPRKTGKTSARIAYSLK